MARARTRKRLDPLAIEVFHHLFSAVAEEMGASLLRAAFSPNVKERRDFSCALFDAEGRAIGQAAHLPVHLGSTPLSVAAAIEHCAMGPGDAIVLNDPYAGGTHLPDITLVSPVYTASGGARPAFYCANRAHHADVGGAAPGSMAPAADVHGEGLRIPPVALVRGGEVVEDTLALLLANMRVSREREGDLLGQWAANRLGERRLLELADEHGAAQLRARAEDLMDWTERLARRAIGALPDGEYAFEDELEVPHAPEGRALVRVRLRVDGERMLCDFSESDDQLDAPVNTVRAVVVSAVVYVLRLLLPPDTPTNEGLLRAVDVRTRSGSVVDARYPASVAAGNVETSQRLVDVLLGALAQAAPERVPAASAGTMSNLAFGQGAREGRAFSYYETLAGGAGGSPEGAGEHALQTHMTNTRNTPIEAFELELPVRVTRYDVRRGSGGAGARRGGDGLVRELTFLEPVRLSLLAERQERGPWGLAGGSPGQAGRARVRSGARGAWKRLPGKSAKRLEAHSAVRVETPGGGGHGAAPG